MDSIETKQGHEPTPFHFAGRETEIDFMELWYVLLGKAKYVVLCAVLVALITGIYTFFGITPLYSATAKLYVLNSDDSIINVAQLQLGNYLASDYQEIFKAWEVNELVRERLDLDYTYVQLQGMLSVRNPSDTRILNISVTSSKPEEAAAIANEFAKVVRDYVSDIMQTEKPSIFSTALKPTQPVKPNKTLNILLGFLAGAFLAVAVIVVRFITDDKIKSTDDIMKYTGMPTLAIVPVLNAKDIRTGINRRQRRSANKKR